MRIAARYTFAAGVLAVVALLSSTSACGGAGFFRQYEYEEEMYLSLDGSGTMYVNTSIAALNALRGTSFDVDPTARFDREVYRRYFSSADTHVTRVSSSRRSGRRFVHVRMDVDDVRRLGESEPFAWSTYRFERDGDHFRYEQTVDGPAARLQSSRSEEKSRAGETPPRLGERRSAPPVGVGWTGNELVAFRLHLPSKIDFHNTGHEVGRGNILVWEQPLTDRLRGTPLALEARMQTQSILYRTLWLFGLTFIAVAIAFVAVICWVVRRGKPHGQRVETAG
jgi:hypothetical protein